MERKIEDITLSDEYESMQTILHNEYLRALENVIIQVMSQYLGREAALEDAKRITIGQNPNWDYILIAIDGNSVGKITSDFVPNLRITFTPSNSYRKR